MPIKDLSDKRRLSRLGRVRLGEKRISKTSGKEYPAALDHFNFEDAPELKDIFGDKCTAIDIIIPNENEEAFFPQYRKAYRASGLFCRGDGEAATRVNVGPSDGDKNSKSIPKGQPLDPDGAKFIAENGLDVSVGDMYDLPCAGEACPFTVNGFCKPIGRFLFMVPKAPRIGVYEISTTSFNSMIELNSAIETIKGVAGRISMIPLRLRLVPKETKVPKTAIKKVIYHLVLEFAGTFADLRQYQHVKQIPLDQLPKRHELEQHVPEDLAAHGGEALDRELAGENNIPGPREVEATVESKTAGTDMRVISGTFLTKKGDAIFLFGEYRIDPAVAKTAKANFKDGDTATLVWGTREGVKWVVELDRKASGSEPVGAAGF